MSREGVGIVVVGQVPPPVGGQAVMIEALLRGNYRRVKLHHARMNFSTSLSYRGKFRSSKVFELLRLIAHILWLRGTTRSRVLYYPPSGPTRLPLYRDIIILNVVRPLFKVTILHFHASGISLMYPNLSRVERYFVRRALFGTSLAIQLSPQAPPDGSRFEAKRVVEVPNGIDFARENYTQRTSVSTLKILFVGLICEGKGIFRVLEAMVLLVARGVDFHLTVAGEFESRDIATRVRSLIDTSDLSSRVTFAGVVTGDVKEQLFLRSTVFLFPSLFESETFPLVLIEAMAAGLPVIASDWRGIPDVVSSGETGILISSGEPAQYTDALIQLHSDIGLWHRMSVAARRRYLTHYTLDVFRSRMDEEFTMLVEGFDGS